MQDLILDDTNGLLIKNGDFVWGEATRQNQTLIILSDKGEFKDAPMRGVGVRRYLEDSKPDNLAREIRTEFVSDGMTVSKIRVDLPETIQVEAEY